MVMPTETRLPNAQEIADLVAFLPRLYAEDFEPIKQWHGGVISPDGSMSMPWPEYDPLVEEFTRAIASGGWLDTTYRPEEAYAMFAKEDFLKTASIPQIKIMLTYFVRGERFSDGHWGAMIKGGHIRRLLERLAELGRIITA
jgi:hypothetical protein